MEVSVQAYLLRRFCTVAVLLNPPVHSNG